jgi:hypothetical protein
MSELGATNKEGSDNHAEAGMGDTMGRNSISRYG